MCCYNHGKDFDKTMTKLFKHVSRFLITLLAFSLACGSLFASVSSAKQLEKAKQLYAENREDEAMDLFIDWFT